MAKKRPARRAPGAAKPRPSDPRLLAIWQALQAHYFPERNDLLAFTVCWSLRRQRRVLASVSVQKKTVRVARELECTDYSFWLEPLLYHEMCHAVLGDKVARRAGKRQWHGAEFKQLEARHPGINPLDAWIKGGGWRQAVRRDRARRASALARKGRTR